MVMWHVVTEDAPELGVRKGDRVCELGHNSRLVRPLGMGGVQELRGVLEPEEGERQEPRARSPVTRVELRHRLLTLAMVWETSTPEEYREIASRLTQDIMALVGGEGGAAS